MDIKLKVIVGGGDTFAFAAVYGNGRNSSYEIKAWWPLPLYIFDL